MECPKCGEKSRVLDCVQDMGYVYRKRKCTECENVFYSKEDVCNDIEAKASITYIRTTYKQISRARKGNKDDRN